MTLVKNPMPYGDNMRISLKASADIEPGMPVDITAANTVTACAATDDEWVGIALYDHAHTRAEGTATYNVGKLVPVRLRSPVYRSIATTTIAVGNFVKLGAGGIGVEATAGTTTLNTCGIALTAGVTAAEIDWVKI